MKNSILIFLFSCLLSCTSNTIFDKPDDLIPKEKMAELLTDLYLASSSKSYRNKLDERNIDYTFLIYEKYGIDSTRFRKSNFYYTTRIDEYEKIYFEVEKNIRALNENFKAIKKIKDSIKIDSFQRVRRKKDSIKKAKKKGVLQDSLSSNIIKMDSLRADSIQVINKK